MHLLIYDVCTYLFTCAINNFTPTFIEYFSYFRDGHLFVKTILLIFSLFRNLISRTEVDQNSISEKCILGAIIHQDNDIVFQKQVRSRTFIHQYMYTDASFGQKC
jgi:hypothetical protein